MQRFFAGKDPKLVLFDLDGTLVDSVPDLAQAIDRMLVEIDRLPAGVEKVRNWVGNGAAVLVKRALSGTMHPAKELDGFDHAYALFLKFYAQATADKSELYSGVEQCLKTLQARGIQLGVVTNKPICFTETMLDGFSLSEYFQVVLGGDSLAQKKPEPEPLLSAMDACDAAPHNTLMVGDSSTDVRAARAAGCSVVCVPYGYNHGEDIALAKPDLVIENLSYLCSP